MRSIKGFVTSLGMVAAVSLTGCMTEGGALEEQGVGEEQSELAQARHKNAHRVVETVARGKREARPTTNRFTLGGTVSGLAGTLVLENNLGEEATVTANGTFAFATPVPSGETYDVTVRSQPTEPSQTCLIREASGAGTIGADDVKSVQIECLTNLFAIGGVVEGLLGSGLVLQNNGLDTVPIEVDGAFEFPTHVPSGESYHVTIRAQPTRPWQLCSVVCDGGTMGAADTFDICVSCSTLTFPIGGTVTGLPSDTYVMLTNNGGDTLMVTDDGSFMFDTPIPSGASYNVQLTYTPPGQMCSVAQGTGILGGAPVGDVSVTCTPIEVQLTDTAASPAGTITACDSGYGVEVDARASQTLTRIELPLSTSDSLRLRFAIFDADTKRPLFASEPISVAPGSQTVASAPMSFAMMPGTRYTIGAVINGCADLAYDRVADVQNGTRTFARSDQLAGFDNPSMAAAPSAPLDVRFRLFGTRP